MRMALVITLVTIFFLSKPVAGSAIRPKGDLLNMTQPEVSSPKAQKWFEFESPRQRFTRSKSDTCPPSQPDPAASIFNFLSSTVLITNVAVNMIVSINTNNNNNNNNDNNNNNNDNNFNSNSLMFTSMNTNMNTAMLPGKRRRRRSTRTTTNAGCSCENETPELVGFRTRRESTVPESPYQNDMRVPEMSIDAGSNMSSVSGGSRDGVKGISGVPEIFIDAVSDMYSVSGSSRDPVSDTSSVSGSSRDGMNGTSSVPEISIDAENSIASVPGTSINPENQAPSTLERIPANSTEMSNNPSWNHSEWNALNWNIMECVSWFICQRLKSKQESSVAAWIMENMTVSILEVEIASFLNSKQIAPLRRAIFKGRYSTSCDRLWEKCHSLM
ncbi:myb-like protein A [Macrobrachium rosenbergii]|uniref:myb-like protein A n=1 Tax=Macrobrachium rosenbergii TaxID=79674 RepID=UPI0034D758B3